MAYLFGNLDRASAVKRFANLLQGYGLMKTLSTCGAMLDDHHLRLFDRRYRIRTSGHVELSNTSFDRSRLPDATSYGPVNGWAFRALLKRLNLSKTLQFADLGCGLGRACILAAEYGFRRVTGVELAPELCAAAEENMSNCLLSAARKSSVHIIQADVLDYCELSEDEVFFVFRAFSLKFFQTVCQKLAERAACQKKLLTLIYSERLGWPPSASMKIPLTHGQFQEVYQGSSLGQAFYVYQSKS
jgi:SAM-dependent methyltransferase